MLQIIHTDIWEDVQQGFTLIPAMNDSVIYVREEPTMKSLTSTGASIVPKDKPLVI